MRGIILLIWLGTAFSLRSQLQVTGIVRDKATAEPLPFCAIALKSKAAGALSNEEGAYRLQYTTAGDSVIFRLLGYRSKTVAAWQLAQAQVVYLEQEATTLEEVVVKADDDYLFDLLDRCRKRLLAMEEGKSKAYFMLQTEVDGQPTELLESYYNATFDHRLRSLQFKNGRAGLAATDRQGYFINLNSSKLFTFFSLTEANAFMPDQPLHFRKRQMKKYFRLSTVSSSAVTGIRHIRFLAIERKGFFFDGELWVNEKDAVLEKISLTVHNAWKQPFEPVVKDAGTVSGVELRVAQTFLRSGKALVPGHAAFSYKLHYHDKGVRGNAPGQFAVETKGVLFYYDYDRLFIPLYYSYDPALSDYRKIAGLSYNDAFWKENPGLVYSKKTIQALKYFRSKDSCSITTTGSMKAFLCSKAIFLPGHPSAD